MQNPIPKSVDELFALALVAANGVANHPEIPVMHSTESVIRAALTLARTKNDAYQASKGERLVATEQQAMADANAVAFIKKARNVFESFLGSRYSQAWNAVGFTNNSLAVPSTIVKRLELVNHIAAYLTSHPERAVPSLQITAAVATGLYAALETAISAMNSGWGAQFTTREERDSAAEALRGILRGLIEELMQLIGPRDPRWVDFGFNIPDAETTPAVPEGLTVRNGSPGHLVADWQETPRAARYRVFRQVIGVDPDFILAKTVEDRDADMNTFVPGSHVRIRVTAVNDAGDSLPSEPVEHVVP